MMSKGDNVASSEWVRVVSVAGIGTVLEWFDFYIYTQLSTILTAVFFPSNDPAAQALSYWGVFAVGFVSRPLGALLFGHIGDTVGRNKQLVISIVAMTIPTIAIACLPSYGIPGYQAGMAAPILLAILRFFQGLAMGGEFGSAIIYISELAGKQRRCTYVTILQCSVNAGLIFATALVMILENTIPHDGMLEYGWRIPFALAYCTAILGFFLRRGLPEPHSFLAAARREKAVLEGRDPSADAESFSKIEEGSPKLQSSDDEERSSDLDKQDTTTPEEGVLTHLHGHHHSKVPFIRMIYNNLLGVLFQVLFMCWVSGAFYLTVSWLPATLRKSGDMAPLQVQGMTIISVIFNAIGLILTGIAFDKGLRAIYAYGAVVLVGVPVAYGVYYGSFASAAGAWCLPCLMQLIVGSAMALVVFPCTRLYSAVERTTSFAFAYNIGYGIVGGLSPMVVAAIKPGLSSSIASLASPFWLTGLGTVSIGGCCLLYAYMPRINKRFIGHLE